MPADGCDSPEYRIEVADSWLVSDGAGFAVTLHKARFESGARQRGFADVEIETFFRAAIRAIPRHGSWFPRLELRSRRGAPSLLFRLRPAPALTTSLRVVSSMGADPRTAPTIKGPDLDSMMRLRTAAQQRGADEAVILTSDGYISDGSTTSLVWWRGEILCTPPTSFDRVDSITAKSLIALARALGTQTQQEATAPMKLDGCELWALNALHGPRIVTEWIDGPSLAEQPGRLALWRTRREALRKPLEGLIE